MTEDDSLIFCDLVVFRTPPLGSDLVAEGAVVVDKGLVCRGLVAFDEDFERFFPLILEDFGRHSLAKRASFERSVKRHVRTPAIVDTMFRAFDAERIAKLGDTPEVPRGVGE